MKTKMDWFLFSVCFSFSFLFLFLLSKGFSIFVNSTLPSGAIDGQFSLDWPISAITSRNMAPLVQKIKMITLS